MACDLEGVVRKLDYVRSLGVDGFWINPFFASPFHDAGYDISDYYRVAPRYGTNDDARRMFAEAEKRGLKVLFDWVISYTSIDHPWFQESAKQERNAYSNWYIWTDNTWVNPPEAYRDAFIKGYGRRNGQFMRNFYWSQPALNLGFASTSEPWMLPVDHPDVLALQEELSGPPVLDGHGRRRLPCGHGGRARQDRPRHRERPVLHHPRRGHEGVLAQDQGPHGRGVSRVVHGGRVVPSRVGPGRRRHPRRLLPLVPGVQRPAAEGGWRILNGYSEGYSFFDKEGKGSITGFLRTYLDQHRKTVGKGYINLPLGNHDLSRLNIARSTDDLQIIYVFSLTMPGIPFLFQGNEIGMRQLDGLPFVEGAPEPRAGVQLVCGAAGNLPGGSAGEAYLPVDPAMGAPNVEAQEEAPDSLLNRVRRLIRLKKKEKALAAYAEFVPVFAKPDTYPFVYARANGDDAVLVILNPAERPASARFRLEPAARDHRLLSGRAVEMIHDRGQYAVDVPGRSYAIYRLLR
jgi:maltose alpha-D-glucosyltransferase/alpha-amylase